MIDLLLGLVTLLGLVMILAGGTALILVGVRGALWLVDIITKPKKPRCQSCAINGEWPMSCTEIVLKSLRAKIRLQALRTEIQCEAKTVNILSHSHNIISIVLRQIAEEFGNAEANKAITDFKLVRLGWRHQPCEHCGHWPCGCGG